MSILGIDEVGRGSWAGPLVMCAFCFAEKNSAKDFPELTDSKRLTKKKREEISKKLHASKSNFAFGIVSSEELDSLGMSESLKLACKRALEQIDTENYSEIIIDGTINFLKNTKFNRNVSTLPKADNLIPEVSAASIVAKVWRDEYMKNLSKKFPEYNFENNSGYGTSKHRLAIDDFGVTPEHRKSFTPIAKHLEIPLDVVKNITSAETITTKTLGDKAEQKVAKHLKDQDHKIIATNWRTKLCEIDIVSVVISAKEAKILFTEVKYRKNAERGGGADAIDAKKLKQMRKSVEVFMSNNKVNEKYTPVLQVAILEGKNFEIKDIFEITEIK